MNTGEVQWQILVKVDNKTIVMELGELERLRTPKQRVGERMQVTGREHAVHSLEWCHVGWWMHLQRKGTRRTGSTVYFLERRKRTKKD